MDVLHLRIPPDLMMHPFPSHGLQRIVYVWQSDPSPVEAVPQQALVCKVVRVRQAAIFERLQYLLIYILAGVHDHKPAVRQAYTCGWWRACILGLVGIAVLAGECTILGGPILGIVWLLQRITCACMTCSIHSISFSFHVWTIQV